MLSEAGLIHLIDGNLRETMRAHIQEEEIHVLRSRSLAKDAPKPNPREPVAAGLTRVGEVYGCLRRVEMVRHQGARRYDNMVGGPDRRWL